MSKKLAIILTLILTGLLFLAGFLSHSSLLSAIRPGTRFIYTSITQKAEDELWFGCSLALLGLSIGIGALLRGRSRSNPRYALSFAILFVAGFVTGAGWALLQAKRAAVAVSALAAALPGVPVSLKSSDVPLYEIGLFASASVLAIAMLSILLRGREKRRQQTSDLNR